MLQEIFSAHRCHQHRPKRWFTDSDMDLFIRFENQRPVCFQFSYNKLQQQRSIGWHAETGFSHTLIKPENRHVKYRTSATNVSECEHPFDATTIARAFLQASEHIETTLADFIFARLIEAPGQLETHSNQALVLKNL